MTLRWLVAPLLTLVAIAPAEAQHAGHGARAAAPHDHPRMKPVEDIAYSELNHRITGGFLVVLAALAAWGVTRPATGRPAVLAAAVWIAFGSYLFVTGDPEAWPIGDGRFAEVFRDPVVLQHKLLAVVPIGIGLVEAVRRRGRGASLAWIVPALAVAGGLGLFVHDHEGGRHVDRIFVQHALMGSAAVVVGGALLAIRRSERWAAATRWAWTVLLGLTALVLLFYRE